MIESWQENERDIELNIGKLQKCSVLSLSFSENYL